MSRGLSHQHRATMLIVLVASAMLCATALAAAPKSGATYRGTGRDFMNNAPRWTAEGTGKISFKTSANAHAVVDFKGGYSYYCGAGTADVTEKSMPVSKSGTFGVRFKQSVKGPNGKVNSTAYAAISGRFENGGTKAAVSYLIH